MIQNKTVLHVSDNTGAKLATCIKILKPINSKTGSLCDIIKVSIKKTYSNNKIKKGDIYNSLIIRVKSNIFRRGGSYLKFDKNCIILLNNNFEILGNRIFGPVPYELLYDSKYKNIHSFISEVI